MSFKGFGKARIPTENFYSTQSLLFLSNFDLDVPPEDNQNQKYPLSYPNK